MKTPTSTSDFSNSVYIFILIGVFFLLFGSQFFYKRLDLTQDKRYTLSDTAVQLLDSLQSPLEIEILLSDKSTSEFRRLQLETIQILEEFSAHNKHIHYQVIQPEELDLRADIQSKINELQIRPAQIQIKQEGKTQTEIIFPWAIANYNGRNMAIPLLKNQLGATQEERIHHSVQNLEYSFVDSFSKLIHPKHKRIAFLKGDGGLEDKFLADFLSTLKEYYFIAPFTLTSTDSESKILKDLITYDLLIITQPTKAFAEPQKHLLDQYLMQGGKVIWAGSLNTQAHHPDTDEEYLIGIDLGLADMFFKYGIRINPDVIKDMYSAPIVIASGNERDSQYERYPWFFYPLIDSENPHPITTNTDPIKLEYASSIDTLPNTSKKTILLSTSPLSKSLGLPYPINLNKEIYENLEVINEGPISGFFGNTPIPLSVLIEGPIPSAYSNRVKPIKWKDWEEISKTDTGKLLVISDGNIIKNQLDGNRPLELGYDKWTNMLYGNKEFLLNSVNYMLDDIGLMELRSKTISIPFLDIPRSIEQRRKWQYINLFIPLGALVLFGLGFYYIRKRKYIQ